MSAASEALAAVGGVVGGLADAMRAGRLPEWRAEIRRAAHVASRVQRFRSSINQSKRLDERAERADVRAAGYSGAAAASSGLEAATYRRRERRLMRIAERLRWRAMELRVTAEGCREALLDLGEDDAVARLDAWADEIGRGHP